MLNFWDWQANYLWVVMMYKGSPMHFFLEETTQEQFFEFLAATFTGYNFASMQVHPISGDSFEVWKGHMANSGIAVTHLIDGERA